MKPALAILLALVLATPAFGQAVLIVNTSHPDVTILVDGRFKGQKNTRQHTLRWSPPAGVIYRVPVQATFRGDVKTKTIDLECGKTVRISFEFPDPPKDEPVLPPPNEQLITIKHDPIEINGRLTTDRLKVDPLKVNLEAEPLRIAGPLEVEPLKIEMEPLEIIIRGDGVGVLPGDPTGDIEEPTEKPQELPAPWDYQLFLMVAVALLVLSFMVFLTRASMLQGKFHKELVDCLRGSRPRPTPLPPTSAPATGEIEVEA